MIRDFEFCMQINAYADGELDAAAARAVESRLATSAYWRAELKAIMSLKVALSAADLSPLMPDDLKARVLGRLHRLEARSAMRLPAAAGLMAAAIAGAVLLAAPSMQDRILSDHVNAVANGHLVDLASSAPETVRGWFKTRRSVVPPVLQSAGGCHLAGGRSASIAHTPVASLVYRCGSQVADFYAYADPDRGPSSPSVQPHLVKADGVRIVAWRRGRLDCFAVSDLPQAQLLALARAIQDHAAEG